MTPIQAWVTRNAEHLHFIGVIGGIDIYYATSQPWMEQTMNPNDPTKPCGCEPVPTKPCCDGGDDEED